MLKRDAKTGAKLYKRLYIKIEVPDEVAAQYVGHGVNLNKDCYFTAQARTFYTPTDIDEAIFKVVCYIDQKFTRHDFRMVQLAPNRFTFICTGERNETAHHGEINIDSGQTLREGRSPDRDAASESRQT